jgi:hypothetical protein
MSTVEDVVILPELDVTNSRSAVAVCTVREVPRQNSIYLNNVKGCGLVPLDNMINKR